MWAVYKKWLSEISRLGPCIMCKGHGMVKDRDVSGGGYDTGFSRCSHCDGRGSRVLFYENA